MPKPGTGIQRYAGLSFAKFSMRCLYSDSAQVWISRGFRSDTTFRAYPPAFVCQIPERSGLPSGALGAGAVRSALPSGKRGVARFRKLIHCAALGPDNRSIKATATLVSGVLLL